MNQIIVNSGILRVTGRDRIDLLHRLSTKDLRTLTPGRTTSTLFTTNQGRLVDWVQILCDEDHLLLRTSPGRAPALKEWIDRYTIMEDVTVMDVSDQFSTVIVWGDVKDLPDEGVVRREGEILLTRGLAAYGPRVEALVPRGTAFNFPGAIVADAQSFERARIEAGVPSPDHEFKEEVNPLELRLTQHAVSWNKGCYIGQEVISRLDSYNKVARLLIGFEASHPITETKIAREGKPLGRVTSFLNTPEGGAVGLAVVKREVLAGEGGVIGDVEIRFVDRAFWW